MGATRDALGREGHRVVSGNNHQPLLTVRQVADWLEVSPKTVLRWTRHGELTAVELPGRRLRYSEDEIVRWLKAHETQGAK